MEVLLEGVVGSTAYGLGGPGSDIDRLGVFAHPASELLALGSPADTHVTVAPDVTRHEARKFCKLALSANPTVSELLWLPRDLYSVRHPLGDELIDIRYAFLSAKRVRDAYLGYAEQQFRKLDARGDGSFSADTRKRTAKHARHLYRLCHQGYQLYSSGSLQVRLARPQEFLEFGERVATGDVDLARSMLQEHEDLFDAARPVLPAEPDRHAVEAWLLRVRAACWDLSER